MDYFIQDLLFEMCLNLWHVGCFVMLFGFSLGPTTLNSGCAKLFISKLMSNNSNGLLPQTKKSKKKTNQNFSHNSKDGTSEALTLVDDCYESW